MSRFQLVFESIPFSSGHQDHRGHPHPFGFFAMFLMPLFVVKQDVFVVANPAFVAGKYRFVISHVLFVIHNTNTGVTHRLCAYT